MRSLGILGAAASLIVGAASAAFSAPTVPLMRPHSGPGRKSVLNDVRHRNRGNGPGLERALEREDAQRAWQRRYYADTELPSVTRQQIRASERASAKRYGARPMRSPGKRPPVSVFVVDGPNRRGEDRVRRLRGDQRSAHLDRLRWLDHGVSGMKAHLS